VVWVSGADSGAGRWGKTLWLRQERAVGLVGSILPAQSQAPGSRFRLFLLHALPEFGFDFQPPSQSSAQPRLESRPRLVFSSFLPSYTPTRNTTRPDATPTIHRNTTQSIYHHSDHLPSFTFPLQFPRAFTCHTPHGLILSRKSCQPESSFLRGCIIANFVLLPSLLSFHTRWRRRPKIIQNGRYSGSSSIRAIDVPWTLATRSSPELFSP
jgi:hypothetical protein